MTYRSGSKLIEQGAISDSMFLLLEGTLSIQVNNEQVAIRTAGYDNIFYGDLSLVSQSASTATIIARDSIKVGVLSKKAFMKVYFNEMFPEREHTISKVRFSKIISF